VHTSDVHIGEDLNPAKRFAGLVSAIDATLISGAQALLIAGDLFDNARVPDSDIEATFDQLRRLEIPVVISNGNHDSLERPSIHERVRLKDAGSHVYFLDEPDGSHVTLVDLGLTVWSRAMTEHWPGFNPVEGYTRLDDGHWQVAMAHGHYFPSGSIADRSSPIHQHHIGDMECDYLALGHWHRFLDVSHNGTPAFYCGSPSEAGGSFASVNLVTLQPGIGAVVERIGLRLSSR
jgi:DNA repair exonuclease SbcCD nuclease subunit